MMNKKEGRSRNDGTDRSRKGSKNIKNTNEDVQRAIEGLKGIPDDELQEFLDDEELQGLNVVDAWEGDEEQVEQRGNRGRHQRRNSGNRNRRGGRRGGFGNRNQDLRDKHEDKKREDARRDPSKSSKDIERDKMRARRDNETKILAEKEKAIKNLLDSDTVVPPGTEVEAIETFDKQIQNNRNNREHNRSSDRHRNQNSSPFFRRSRGSPRGRGRNTFFNTPERRRRTSWDRKSSLDRRERRISPDRQFRRRIDEREFRLNRRSRSSIRSRSRDRSRRRWSRSPIRGSGHGDSRRRSISKSPERRRKRSPFLHEIARQLNNDALLSGNINNQGFNQQIQPLNIQPPPPQNHHGNLQLPPHHYGHPETMVGPYSVPFEPQPPVQPVMNFEQIHQPIHQHMDYNPPPPQQQQPPVQPPPHVLFNQMPQMVNDNHVYQAPVLLQTPNIPQPVPAPMQTDQFIQHSSTHELPQPSPDSNRRISDEHRYRDDFNEKKMRRDRGVRHNRLVTPEPPIISEKKFYEKTSLSSLLEASVLAKGFKPEIIKNCEQALRELPDEDHRLRMKGRFFYDSKSEDEEIPKQPEYLSNSILLNKNKTHSLWLTNDKKIDSLKNTIETHQKYCQTEIEYNDISVQTSVEMIDFCVQVCPGDLRLSPLREDKRPIMDRLDWNVREHNDYVQREVDDLRWSLSSNPKRSYKRTLSPDDDIIRQNIADISQHNFIDINRHNIDNNNFNQNLERPIRDGLSPSPHDYRPDSPLHNRNDTFDDSPYRSNYNQHNNDRYSPNFRRNIDNYDDNISQHSRNRSPDIIEERNDHHHHRHGDDDDDDDVQVLDDDIFTRESNWRERGSSKTFGSSTNLSHKSRPSRGKFTSGRSFRARGNSYRGRY